MHGGVALVNMQLKHEITPENLKIIEIKQIALDKDKFGALVFDRAYPALDRLRKTLVEFQELNYTELLTREEVKAVDSYRDNLLKYVRRIHALDPATDAGFNINLKQNLENEIENFCRSTTQQLRTNLVFLRQESALGSEDKQALAEQQKAATLARKQAEEILNQLQSRLETLNEREKELENKSGKVGALALAIHFTKETTRYQNIANKWFLAIAVSYVVIITFILGVAYHYSFGGGDWNSITWQQGAGKLVLFATFWYGLSFIIRNYNVSSHLAAVNRHRAAVAGTLEDFLGSNPTATGEMLQNGTEAMFKQAPIGYITRAEKESTSPLLEVVNKFLAAKTD